MASVDTSYRDSYVDSFANQRKTQKTTNQSYNLIFTDKPEQSLEVDDFLNLMVMQMSNQDFMNPMDDSQMLAQMAQFATMEQMQQLGEYSKSNYATSLLGQVVTASKYSVGGDTETVTGPVQKISLANNEYILTINGKTFSLGQIMELRSSDSKLAFDASSYSLTKSATGPDWVEINWPCPTQDDELKETLKYTVYYSEGDKKMNTVEEILENGTMVGLPGRKDLSTEIINGLEPDKTYHFNVIVEDDKGNKSAYQSFAYYVDPATAEPR